ncbi:MAG: hypothetical protein C4524_12870 [Candidatus Zixiibacteriota bacterium]|nr:MAG: hypothetical protein C4524_12870 [candidate division Zixibacteria bacterium]
MNPWKWLTDPRHEAMIQFVLFAALVVATPFVVVTRYLQSVAQLVSHLSLPLPGVEVPGVLILAAGLALFLAWRYRSRITRRRLAALAVLGGMVALGHWTMDLYLDLTFFDLQENWHYVAYGAYMFFFFRAFNLRRMPLPRMILWAYGSALLMSLFDETFQFFLSHRVFDLSDVTKDAWGVIMGLVLVIFVTESAGTIDLKRAVWRRERLGDYLRHPETALLSVFGLTTVFLFVSPLLTEHAEIPLLLATGFGLFAVAGLLFHLSRHRAVRIALGILAVVAVLGVAGSRLAHRGDPITHNTFGLTVYRGMPLPFFDVLIYPDGGFRFVDKKHHFRSQDLRYLLMQEPDVLLVGSGNQGRGGQGFPQPEPVQFIYNEFTGRGTQVIILPTPEACRQYNSLVAAGKKVLFILHNSC